MRMAASAAAGVCMLVLLPIATNIATGGAVPAFLRQAWVSWTGVALFGLVAVATYVPQAQPAPQPVPPPPAVLPVAVPTTRQRPIRMR